MRSLHLLRMSSKKYQFYQIDQGFKYRNFFMLLVTSFFVIRLLFFPESVARNFPSPLLTPQMAEYLRLRGWYMLVVMLLYLYSYHRDKYFEAVAFVVFELAICNMVGDFVNIYSKFTFDSVPAALIFLSLIRFATTVCLFLNTFNSHRAPLPPRRFWPALNSAAPRPARTGPASGRNRQP